MEGSAVPISVWGKLRGKRKCYCLLPLAAVSLPVIHILPLEVTYVLRFSALAAFYLAAKMNS